MPIASLPNKIEQLNYEIETLRKSIQLLETPITAQPKAAAGSLLATMSETLEAIGDAEELDRSRITKLEAMRNLLSDAELTLKTLQGQQLRSKPLYDAGLLRLEKNRKDLNNAIDKVLSSWDKFQESLTAISDDSLIQTGVIPFHRAEYPMNSAWLTELGKIGPLNAQSYYPVVRSYEFDRIHSDE